MGRPGLTNNRKFKRLARDLTPACRAFAEQVARGSLELLWEAAYESGDDYVGDASDVEASAHWTGKTGVLCAALAAAGGEGEAGFIEEIPERPGHFIVHDLYDHAPEYVQKRMEREAERIKKGKTISDVRREAALKRWDANGSKCPPLADERDANVLQASANVGTPSPTPTPSPTQEATDGGQPEEAPADPPPDPPAPLTLLPQEPAQPLTPLLAYLAVEFVQAKADPAWEAAQRIAYPGVDLLAEAKAARAWELSNPTLIKTQKRRFLGNWFAKAQNAMRRSPPPRSGAATLQITPDAKAEHAVPGRKFL